MKRKSIETDEILSVTDQRRLEMDIRKDYLRYNQLSGELHDLDIQDAKRIETVKKIVIVLESLRMMGNAELKYSALLKNKKFDPPDADDQEEEKDDTEDDVPKVKEMIRTVKKDKQDRQHRQRRIHLRGNTTIC
ncbi:unnamed protein product [Ambrosiozyma monospora]|uniref:Unnamed protein product n=1 Tax=Ambrosiozyma monospora TaxID=43982 RepID=A0A9W6T349_AMBMO|nr:unnamed protein product [Ambrosiozyma monospora]